MHTKTNTLGRQLATSLGYCSRRACALIMAMVVLTMASVAQAAPSDLNGDNRSDLLVHSSSGGQLDAYLMNGTTVTASTTLMAANSGWTVTHMADLNGDGRADILWQHTDGRVATWLMNGFTPLSGAVLMNAGLGWSISHTADLNGDGKADIIWKHTDGRVATWLMNGIAPLNGAVLMNAGLGWSISHTADLNGDGKADIIWKHTDGRVATWLMDGLNPLTGAVLMNAGQGWTVSHAADFNGDGKADIVWRHTDGRVAAWLMNGLTTVSGGVLVGAGTGWSVSHTADFNGDGKADILWRHTDGSVAAWLMNGLAPSATPLLGANTGWSVTHTSEMNGDGKADLLWRHDDGRVAIWLMNGAAALVAAPIFGAGTRYVAPNADITITLAPVDGPTVAAIDRTNRQAVLNAFTSIYVPTKATPYSNSGLNVAACAAGDTTLAYKTAVIRMANYFRAMSGLPGNVALNLSWSAKAQQAALMMNANGTLNHSPPTTWTCYSAAGAEAAGHSNLAGGIGGPGALDLYMSDGGVPSLGHRRWILYPPQAEIGTGDTTNYNSLWVLGPFGTRAATPNGVAWPAAGFVPYALAPSSMAWSFSVDGANFASTTVSVTKVGGGAVPVTVSVLPSGYGDETISFAPSGAWPYATTGDTSFDVQVRGVVVSGASRDFGYRVTLIPAP
jgi:uncharacterized protein YkwD